MTFELFKKRGRLRYPEGPLTLPRGAAYATQRGRLRYPEGPLTLPKVLSIDTHTDQGPLPMDLLA
jgi:hypothetical protein